MTSEPGTHCPYCALQCGMTLSFDGEPKVGPRNFPTNKGGLCRKGWTAASLLRSPERLLKPLIRDRKGGEFREAEWGEALDRIACQFRAIRAAYGADAVGIFGGGGLTNEKAYLLGKFARVALQSRHIDYNGRFCMASAAAAGVQAFGIDRGLPFPLEDLCDADVVLIAGGNPADTMPPIMQYFEEQRRRGGKLIVADPRRSATARQADLHLQLAPGTDTALANGLLNILIREQLIDETFIAERTTGFAAVRHKVGAYWPDRVERITGVLATTLVEAAELLGHAERVVILTARGAEQQTKGVDNVLGFINLILALGKVGKPSCGYGCLTGQGNGQGGREHGQKADQLPGYRKLDDPKDREWIASIWGIDSADLPPPGVSACELMALFGEGVQALMVMAANPLVSSPDASALLPRLEALRLLVVCDFFMSETAQLADIVLPVTQWAEEDGTMTNLEGRILLRRRQVEPPDGVRTDLWILSELAARLGTESSFPKEPRAAFDELRRASAGGTADYAGVTYERILEQDGIFWPCPSEDHPGTPRLFADGFPTEDGRARFHAVDYRPASEEPDDQYPFMVTTGRLALHYQSGAQTRRVPELAQAEPEPFVEIHPQLARTYGIAQGDLVRVTTRRGQALLQARFSADIRMDTLFVPFHWGGTGSANLLTGAALDPVSRIPEFKVSACKIERVAAAVSQDLVAAD